VKTTSEDTRRWHELLAHLATVNQGMGRSVQRLLAHEAEHGHIPADELRELAVLLYEVATEVADYADTLDRTAADSP
jgi:hypothetical protein